MPGVWELWELMGVGTRNGAVPFWALTVSFPRPEPRHLPEKQNGLSPVAGTGNSEDRHGPRADHLVEPTVSLETDKVTL